MPSTPLFLVLKQWAKYRFCSKLCHSWWSMLADGVLVPAVASLSCFYLGTPSREPALDFHDCSWPSRRSCSKWADERENVTGLAGRGKAGEGTRTTMHGPGFPESWGYYSIPVRTLPPASELHGVDRTRRYHWFWLHPYWCSLLSSNSYSFFPLFLSSLTLLPVPAPSHIFLIACMYFLKWKGYTNRTPRVPGWIPKTSSFFREETQTHSLIDWAVSWYSAHPPSPIFQIGFLFLLNVSKKDQQIACEWPHSRILQSSHSWPTNLYNPSGATERQLFINQPELKGQWP